MSDAAEPKLENIGVILVHGIGEQRRFQHLDWQLRELILSLQELQKNKQIEQFSVDVSAGNAAAFHAEHDTWNAGPEAAVDIAVRHRLHGEAKETHLKIHEVWWADINEPYSIAKQLRFWFWGLAIWAHPGQKNPRGASAHKVEAPPASLSLSNRLQLFLVGTFFVLVGYSFGVIGVIVTRLFNLRAPRLLRVLANYVSAVKLYSQDHRFGTGLGRQEDFLDSVGLPPRVSIRRRMMRAVADVAYQRYDRWYILAHSQGTVVAFNALMDTAEVWPAYLDETRWKRLRDEAKPPLAGKNDADVHAAADQFFPPRPVWVPPGEIVFRKKLFERFRGLLTYGSPLAKFAGIWPGVVPVSLQDAFAENVRWLNLYDPIDPVSGLLAGVFRSPDSARQPAPIDIGYAAGPVLLASHLHYLTPRKVPMDAATATVHWLLTDCPHGFPGLPATQGCQLKTGAVATASSSFRSGAWFEHGSPAWRGRKIAAWATWLVAVLVLAFLGAWILPILLKAASAAVAAIWTGLKEFAPDWGSGLANWIGRTVTALSNCVADYEATFSVRVVTLLVAALLLTLLVGGIARLRWKRDPN